MASAVPEWIQILQALLTPVIAAGVGFIAYQQWKVAERKLALDLFDRRMGLYEALTSAARDALNKPDIHVIFRFSRAERDARFLFGHEIRDRLKSVSDAIVTIVGATEEIQDAARPDRNNLILERRKAQEAVAGFVEGFADELSPYMRMDHRLPEN